MIFFESDIETFLFSENSQRILLSNTTISNSKITSFIYGTSNMIEIISSFFDNNMKLISLIDLESGSITINDTTFSQTFSNSEISFISLKKVEEILIFDNKILNNLFQKNFIKSIESFNLQIYNNCFANNNFGEAIFDFEENWRGVVQITKCTFAQNIMNNLIKLSVVARIVINYLFFQGNALENNSGSILDLENVLYFNFSDSNFFQIKQSVIKIIQNAGLNKILFHTEAFYLIFENIDIKDTNGQIFSSEPALIYIHLKAEFQIKMNKLTCSYLNDSSTSNFYLILMNTPNTEIFMDNLNFLKNRFLLSLMELYGYSIYLNNSFVLKNTNLGFRTLGYYSSYIYETNLTVIGNSAYISGVTISAIDYFTFQYYVSDGIFCESNVVDLFGSCLKYTPTNNGNFTMQNSIMINSHSNFMSATIDIFCTNPSVKPSFYILYNTKFVNNYCQTEGGTINYFFHDPAYMGLVLDSLFISNSADKGGALSLSLDNHANKMKILNTIFLSNRGEGGGGVSIIGGTVEIINCYFQNNSAIRGGSIESINFNLLYVNSTIFLDSWASNYGGAFLLIDNAFLFGFNLTIEKSMSNFGSIFYLDSFSGLQINSSFFKNFSSTVESFIFLSKSNLKIPSFLASSFLLSSSIPSSLPSSSPPTFSSSSSSSVFLDHSTFLIMNSNLKEINGIFLHLISSSLSIQNLQVQNLTCPLSTLPGCMLRSLKSHINWTKGAIQGIQNKANGGFFLSASQLEMYDVTIEELERGLGGGDNVMKGGIFYMVEGSKLDGQRMKWRRIEGGGVYGEGGIIWLKELEGEKGGGGTESFLELKMMEDVKIDGCRFINISSYGDGGVIKIDGKKSNNDSVSLPFLIKNCTFERNVGNNGGAIYLQDLLLYILGNSFYNNEAVNGGVFYFKCTDYLNPLCSMKIEQNIFSNNFASRQGGVLSWLSKPALMVDNSFKNNVAAHYGNITASIPVKMMASLNLANPQDEIGLSALSHFNSSYSTRFSSNNSNHSLFMLSSIMSGQKIPAFDLYLVDSEGLIVKDVESTLKLYLSEKPEGFNYNETNINNSYSSDLQLLEGETLFYYNYSRFQVREVKVVAKPSSVVYLVGEVINIPLFRTELIGDFYSLNNYNSSDFSFKFIIPMHVNPCKEGEIYSPFSNMCSRCPEGTFSYSVFAEKCKECPDHVICLGGNDLIIDKGFWRKNNKSKNIYACDDNLGVCLGGLDSACKIGYEGPLCEVCSRASNESNVARNYFGFCTECQKEWLNYLITFLFLLIVIFLGLLAKSYFCKYYNKDPINVALIRIIINHYQVITIMPNLTLAFKKSNNNIFGSLVKNWFTFDCILAKLDTISESVNRRLLMINVCLIGMLGIFYLLNSDKFLSLKFRLKQFLKAFQEKKKNPDRKKISSKFMRSESITTSKRNSITLSDSENIDLEKERGEGLIIFASIFLYTLQISMIDLSFSGFKCYLIEETWYNRSDMNYICWESRHLLWFVILYIPSSIFWIFGVPRILKNWYHNYKPQGKKKRTYIICYLGIKCNLRKYEIWLCLSKYLSIIILSVLIEEEEQALPFIQFCLISCIIAIYFWLQPFNFKVLNRINLFSLFIQLSNYYFLAIIKENENFEIAQIFFAIFLLFNSWFGIVCIFVLTRKQIKIWYFRKIKKEGS